MDLSFLKWIATLAWNLKASWWNSRHWPAKSSATEFCKLHWFLFHGSRRMILCKSNTVAGFMFIFMYYRTGKKIWPGQTTESLVEDVIIDEILWAAFSTHYLFWLRKKKKNTWEDLFTSGGSVLFTPNGLCELKIAIVIHCGSFSSASEFSLLTHSKSINY